MKTWMVLYRKENLEMWRSGKWLWVPVVAILLSVMNPVSSYYMPQILDMAGNMPEGTIIQIPVPKPHEVMADTLSQFGTMGVLILVLASMGIVASERTGGAAAMIMVKPVKHASFITAKWAALLTLGMSSFLAGYASAWYYTELLIGHVDPGRAAAAFGLYGLWLVFILTLTVLMSTWLKGSGAVAFITLFLTAGVSIAGSLLPRFTKWSPGRLADQANTVLMSGKPEFSAVLSVTVALLLIGFLLAASVQLFRRVELAE